MPGYSLAPECPYPRALDECVDFVQSFTASAQYADCQIVLSGDSAGGGLALSAAMKMRDAGCKLPACLVLLCPWLDLALKSESISRNRENAIILKRGNLEAFAAPLRRRCGRIVPSLRVTGVWRFTEFAADLYSGRRA